MGARAIFKPGQSFDRFAVAIGVPTEHVAAVIPRGGHEEPELWHVFFTTPATPEGDAWDVLLGPAEHGRAGELEERSSRRMLVGFFDELYRTLDEIACGPIDGSSS